MGKRSLEMSGAPLSNYGEPAQPQSLLTLTGPSSRWQTFEVPTEEGPWARASGGANGPALRARPAPTQHIDAQQLWDPLHRRVGSAKRQKKGEVETAEKMVARAGGGAEKIAGGEALVGATVTVYWGGDREWFTGVVKSYDAATRRHLIHYDDGDKKWHELDQTGEVHFLEKWFLLLEPCAALERAAASSGVSPPHLSQLPRLAKGKAAAAPKQPLVGPPKPTEEHGDRPEGTISPNTVMDGLDWPKVGVEGEAVEVRVGEVEEVEEEQEEQVEEKEVEEVGEGEGEEGERAVLDLDWWQKDWQKLRGLLGARVGVEGAFGAWCESWVRELDQEEEVSTELDDFQRLVLQGGQQPSSEQEERDGKCHSVWRTS